MVLTDLEDVEAELVGELGLFHEVLHAQRGLIVAPDTGSGYSSAKV